MSDAEEKNGKEEEANEKVRVDEDNDVEMKENEEPGKGKWNWNLPVGFVVCKERGLISGWVIYRDQKKRSSCCGFCEEGETKEPEPCQGRCRGR